MFAQFQEVYDEGSSAPCIKVNQFEIIKLNVKFKLLKRTLDMYLYCAYKYRRL